MSALQELISQWRDEVGTLRRCGAEEAARTTETRASELEDALRASETEIVSLAEAALLSRYSPRRLRQLVAEGKLENVGETGAPRFRRGDVPLKPGPRTTPPGGFDPDAEARSITGAG